MALYYFHFWNGAHYEIDDTGVEFADAESAFLDAFRAARTMAVEHERAGENPLKLSFDIMDRRGAKVLHLPFSEALGSAKHPAPRRQRRASKTLRAELQTALSRSRATMAQSRALVERSRAQPTS
jgi:hypothetical protein